MLRCFPKNSSQTEYCHYHDTEWGVPVFDDRLLFEMLSLEGTQAGLSWEIVLKKRAAYKEAFFNFEPHLVASMKPEIISELMLCPTLIRNRRKLASILHNAPIFIAIQREYGSFANYLWGYTGGKPIVNHFKTLKEVPCFSPLSEHIAKDLKKRGMSFVGKKIIYSFLQAVGVVNDHLADCPFKRA